MLNNNLVVDIIKMRAWPDAPRSCSKAECGWAQKVRVAPGPGVFGFDGLSNFIH